VAVVERISWWSRLKQSLFGFLFSFVVIVGALVLLAWNEHRTLKNHQGLVAAGEQVVAIDPMRLDRSLEGRLVHLSARVESQQVLRDPDFGVEAPGLVLRRQVEMYQWKEEQRTEEREKLGGGVERITTYRYAKVWNEELIDSTTFHESGHSNPRSMPYRSQRYAVADARIGAFAVDDQILNALDARPLALAEAGTYPDGFRLVDGGTLYSGRGQPSSPQIGDVRVRYTLVPAQDASVMAAVQGDKLVAWTSPVGTSIFLVETGTVSAEQMVAHAQSANSLLGWLLRGVGLVAMWIAFRMMLSPLRTVAAVLPPLGRLVGAATGMVSFVLAAVIALTTIVLSWILVRPVWAVSVVIAIVVVIAMWSRRGAQQGAAAAPPPMPPPPPPPRR
jgi:hypothetical protein